MNASSCATFRASYVCRRAGDLVSALFSVGWLFFCGALLGVVPILHADVLVPAAVPFHLVHNFAVVVPVFVNGSGPYDFMLDTGSTITSVDRELGRQLSLDLQGQATVTTLVEQMPVAVGLARQVSVGPITEQGVMVMVRDLKGLRVFAPAVRGVLGQNVLDHANFLLDYRHKMLEFDVDGALGRSLAGHHVPMRRAPLEDNPLYANLAIRASVAGDSARDADFLLDSGTASLVLFAGPQSAESSTRSFVKDTAGREQAAGVRSLQLVIDGKSREVLTSEMSFRGAGSDIGGLLPTAIFRSIYVSNSDNFVILEPKEPKQHPADRMIAKLGQ